MDDVFYCFSGTCITFCILTGLCYAAYGWEFLEETYLHHLTRRDTRHNFSVYFYMLYLTVEDDDVGISLLTFVPQFLLLLALSKVLIDSKFLPHTVEMSWCWSSHIYHFYRTHQMKYDTTYNISSSDQNVICFFFSNLEWTLEIFHSAFLLRHLSLWHTTRW